MFNPEAALGAAIPRRRSRSSCQQALTLRQEFGDREPLTDRHGCCEP